MELVTVIPQPCGKTGNSGMENALNTNSYRTLPLACTVEGGGINSKKI